MSKSFVFKQFTIHQLNAAFKLGTDSVLLGCWLPANDPQNILDIGAGTGILSLICAQRFEGARIKAIEIDEGSYKDLANNFTQSLWSTRLEPVHSDVLAWCENNKNEKFDLIISNPPYFQNSLLNSNPKKSGARHNQYLGLKQLSETIGSHLSDKGSFCVVLPIHEFGTLERYLSTEDIFPSKICILSSFESSEPIRKLGVFKFGSQICKEEKKFIYNPDKSRSDWYKNISAAFYLT